MDLQVTQLNQLLVPTPFQFAGDQTIVGIDRVILPSGPCGFVLRLLDGVIDLPALIVLLLASGRHCRQCGFDPKRL